MLCTRSYDGRGGGGNGGGADLKLGARAKTACTFAAASGCATAGAAAALPPPPASPPASAAAAAATAVCVCVADFGDAATAREPWPATSAERARHSCGGASAPSTFCNRGGSSACACGESVRCGGCGAGRTEPGSSATTSPASSSSCACTQHFKSTQGSCEPATMSTSDSMAGKR